MKITFKRNQIEKTEKAGLMKTKTVINFTLNCVVQLTDVENALFQKHDLFGQSIIDKGDNTFYNVLDFSKGVSFEHWRLASLQEKERDIKEKLTNLKFFAITAEEYKGEETIDI